MTLVILAAGMGSRYGGLKQLDPMTKNGEFIIDFSIYDAIRAGFDRVVFIIKRENYDLFRETVGKRVEKRIKVEYAFQELCDVPRGCTVPAGREKPWGTAHAVLATRDIVKDNFAVINADDFYGREAFMKLAEHLKNATNKDGVSHSCMIGYVLENTLTDHGTVSRGVCETDADGMLIGITERTRIKKDGESAAYLDGEEWVKIPYSTIVSMNCWGFTPEIFAEIGRYFADFMAKDHPDPLKSESLRPSAVGEAIERGKCDVKVYSSGSRWYGVTYKEDKEYVKASIRSLIESGEYPEGLWE